MKYIVSKNSSFSGVAVLSNRNFSTKSFRPCKIYCDGVITNATFKFDLKQDEQISEEKAFSLQPQLKADVLRHRGVLKSIERPINKVLLPPVQKYQILYKKQDGKTKIYTIAPIEVKNGLLTGYVFGQNQIKTFKFDGLIDIK